MGIELRADLSVEEARELAKKQRPGVQIIMGPTAAREELVEPIDIMTCLQWALALPGDWTWRDHDLRKLCGGHLPSAVTRGSGFHVEDMTGVPLTREEWLFLDQASQPARCAFVKERVDPVLREIFGK